MVFSALYKDRGLNAGLLNAAVYYDFMSHFCRVPVVKFTSGSSLKNQPQSFPFVKLHLNLPNRSRSF